MTKSTEQRWQKYALAVNTAVVTQRPELSGRIGWDEVRHGFFMGWAVEATVKVVIRLGQEREAK